MQAPAMAEKNRRIAAGELGAWLRHNFIGWHHGTLHGVKKTAFAAVPHYGKGWKTILEAIKTTSAVAYGCPKTEYDKYIALLHNNGRTLQTREDNMILTRPLRCVVRGPDKVAESTLCDVQGYVVCTQAHLIAEGRAIETILTEATRLVSQKNPPNCLLTKLHSPAGAAVLIAQIRQCPTIKNLTTLMPTLSVTQLAIIVQATAVIMTGYADAGTKFRDRASRTDAARHLGEAVRAILLTPL